jgi:hypothetical protein
LTYGIDDKDMEKGLSEEESENDEGDKDTVLDKVFKKQKDKHDYQDQPVDLNVYNLLSFQPTA